MDEKKMRRWMIVVGALFCCMTALTTVGCRADEEVKQGYEGELCFASSDCRQGFMCNEFSVCSTLEIGALSCDTLCARMDACEAPQERCAEACRNTVQGWSEQAFESFGECILTGLSCEEMRTEYAPQVCYERVPLSAERDARCGSFIDAVKSCDASASTIALRNSCRLIARTRTDELWKNTDACAARVVDGVCSEIFTCLNSVFNLTPALDYAP
ncbi:MAG: hypothetical protein H0U74_21915 [Bradymonadaceae bacterium]|nr:hypothetical protein [Lujinxingiaceae bacterium]